jgi:hypothetical protein
LRKLVYKNAKNLVKGALPADYLQKAIIIYKKCPKTLLEYEIGKFIVFLRINAYI